MRKLYMIIGAALCLLLFSACGNESSILYEHPPVAGSAAGSSWTVLVYMIGGDGEAEYGFASEKLRDIMSVDYPANIHIAVETGGSAEWHTKGVYNDYLQRFEAVGDGKMYLADQMQTASMGDYRTLTEFIMWGTSRYRADNYMLIISGTGGGSMYGIGSDALFGYDCLNLEELSYALSVAGTKFDVICMDASLMGSLETATAVANYTDYLVAPQDVQNADDWDYKHIFGYICDNNNAPGEDICREICDSYYRRAAHKGGEEYAAMSVIDASKISTLNQSFDGMAGDMLIATDSLDNYKNLANALDHVRIYGGATDDEGWSDVIDLGDMAQRCYEYVGATADSLMAALNNSVVYSVRGSCQTGASGLGVYYPLDHDAGKLQEYMDMSHASKYKEFLRKICVDCDVWDGVTNTDDYNSSWAWQTYASDMAWLEYLSVLDGNSYELHINGNMDLFKSIGLNVYRYDKKSGRYVEAGRYRDISGDWEGGIFKADIDCILPQLMGRTVSMKLVRSYDGYDIYSIAAVINGKVSGIRVRYENGSYDIIGCWGMLDGNGQAVSALGKLKASDRITPMLSVYDEHNSAGYVLGKTGRKLWRGVKEEKTADGSYIMEFVMTDIYGLERYGTPVNAKVSGKRVIYN